MEFSYTALRPDGEEKGRIEAPSQAEALKILRAKGLVPVEIKPIKRKNWFFKKNLSEDDLLLFTEHLRQLIEGGLPLDRALDFLEGVFQATNKKNLAQMANRLRERVRKGQSLSQALEEEPDISHLYVQLIRAGEVAGNLSEVLKALEDYLKRQKHFRSEIISSSLYPLFLVVFGLFAIQTVLVYVLPRFAVIFQEFGTDPPLITKILLRVGLFWKEWGPLILCLLGVFFLVAVRLAREKERRRQIETFVLRIPYLGTLLLLADLARIFRALGVMLSGGLSLYKATLQAARVATLQTLRQLFEEGAEQIRRGISLRVALTGLPAGASFVLDFLGVGEESGDLPRACTQIARICEERFSSATTRILKLMEPISVLVFGLFVGAVLISVLIAIFDIQP